MGAGGKKIKYRSNNLINNYSVYSWLCSIKSLLLLKSINKQTVAISKDFYLFIFYYKFFYLEMSSVPTLYKFIHYVWR